MLSVFDHSIKLLQEDLNSILMVYIMLLRSSCKNSTSGSHEICLDTQVLLEKSEQLSTLHIYE